MKKYYLLQEFLKNNQEKKEITLSFVRLEKIIRSSLPKSAYNHAAWWSNSSSHSQANNWLEAGWCVKNPQKVVEEKEVTFKKIKKDKENQTFSYEKYSEEYHFLTNAALDNQENFEKTILTLSSSFLALSVSLLCFYKVNEIKNSNLLFWSWKSFFSSILLILLNFKFSELSISVDISRIEKIYKGKEPKNKNIWNYIVECLYIIAGLMFLIGIVLLISFSESQIL